MKTIWQGRVVQATSKYGEHAPMAAVCCNACRACVSTNLASLALAAVGGAALAVRARISGRARRRRARGRPA